MIWILILLFSFAPFHSYGGFFEEVKESGFVHSVAGSYRDTIFGKFFSEGGTVNPALESKWEDVKIKAKEEAGIDFTKFGTWLAGALSKLFSWLAVKLGEFAG